MIDVTESVSDTPPTVITAVRKRHYPTERLVLRVSRLRVSARFRLLFVSCLHVITFHVPLLY